MNAYIAQIRMNLRLTLRDRSVLFFSYLFPLIFFFMFGQIAHAEQGGATQIVNMVLTIGVLGSGFFGAAMRAIGERERNILRRFKVAPISAGPILVSSLVTGLVTYLPLVVLVLGLAHGFWNMPAPQNPVSLYVFLGLGVIAFRAMGGIIASVANSMQEGQVLVQLFYTPMLLLGGATIPLAIMPEWLQIASQFLPSTHFSTGIQGILLRNETIMDNLPATGALLITAAVATFLGAKLFRWDKDEKLRPTAKLWVLGVMAPFFAIGVWQAHAKTNLGKEKMTLRELNRSRSFLIRDVKVFAGDGQILDQQSVLIRDGKIAKMFSGSAPDTKTLKAEEIDGSGKTLLPGLIDVSVHLSTPGIFSNQPDNPSTSGDSIDRELAAYLYSGVTTVNSAGDELDLMMKHRSTVSSGETLGAELFVAGFPFTGEGSGPPQASAVHVVKSPEDARVAVAELKKSGGDGVIAIMQGMVGMTHFGLLDPAVFSALVQASHDAGLPLVCSTENSTGVAAALQASINGIEHGSISDAIQDSLFIRMKDGKVSYIPALAGLESMIAFRNGNLTPLQRSLVAQVTPRPAIESTATLLQSPRLKAARAAYGSQTVRYDFAEQNLAAAFRSGVTLVTGTDSGAPLLVHGPAIHRELALWVKAGIPTPAALQAATFDAARLIHADNRIGAVREGYDANLLLVDGDPIEDISATERISEVIFHGERVDRRELFKQE